jgi:hypothetical protein
MLSKTDIEFFKNEGYLVVKSPAIAQMKRRLQVGLKEMAVEILQRHPFTTNNWQDLSKKELTDIIDWCIANESDNAVTRVFYELFQANPAVFGTCIDDFFIDLSKQLDLGYPIPSVPTVLRIDRPFETRYMEPAHQDYWYSMLCDNSVTYWFPLFSMTPDMGELRVAPKTHLKGALPIECWMEIPNRFTLKDPLPESSFIPVSVGDDELVVFSQFLVHRSGENRGRRARVSLQVRHNDVCALDNQTSSFTPKASAPTTQAQQELLARSRGMNVAARA